MSLNCASSAENGAAGASFRHFHSQRNSRAMTLYQEIVSNAWSSFTRFKGDSKFSTWLYRVALNVAITSLKKKKRLPFDPLAEAPELEVKSTDDGELRQQIMRQLNPIEKSIVLLLIDGMEQHEIAEIVGISAGNVRVKIHRIREKLRKYGIQGFVE